MASPKPHKIIHLKLSEKDLTRSVLGKKVETIESVITQRDKLNMIKRNGLDEGIERRWAKTNIALPIEASRAKENALVRRFFIV